MALSGKARSVLAIACGDKTVAKEIADKLDAAASASGTGAQTIAGATTFTGGVALSGQGMTLVNVDIALGTSTGSRIGAAANQKLGFHGATPVVQRAGAAQAAVTSTVGGAVAGTASTSTTPFGYAQAQADAIVANINALRVDLLAAVALVNELRAAMVEKGSIKGAA